MAEPRLIGLAGFKRSGKDTAAQALLRAGGWVRVAFADALREEVFKQYPAAAQVPDAQKDRPRKELGGRSLRALLIEIGMQRRAQDPDYWVRLALDRIAIELDNGHSVVVTDVRMPNEVDALRRLGALLVWIKRPGTQSNGHVTEQDISADCDLVLHNYGTPEDLARKMMGILGNRCGACANMVHDETFPQFGFCKVPTDPIQGARLLSTTTRCVFGAYAPLKGYVPPPRQPAVAESVA